MKKDYISLGLKRMKITLSQKRLFESHTHKIEVLDESDIKNISFEKSQVFNKEDYINESEKKNTKNLNKIKKI